MTEPTTLRPGERLTRLLEIMTLLRSKDGCPWDREQTHRSLKPCVLEETYEVLEAIDNERPDQLQEELGDLLLQVVFHAQLASEEGQFTMNDVIDAVCEKMIRRHPHVFGDVQVNGVAGVLSNWEKIKKTEHPEDERSSVLDGIPKDLPALLKAEKIQAKAAKVGFDWDNIIDPLDKTYEEFSEFTEVLEESDAPEPGSADWDRLEDEFGDILFSLVNVGRFLKINPELALGRTISKFNQRFRFVEAEAEKAGKKLEDMSLTEMDELWEKAK